MKVWKAVKKPKNKIWEAKQTKRWHGDVPKTPWKRETCRVRHNQLLKLFWKEWDHQQDNLAPNQEGPVEEKERHNDNIHKKATREIDQELTLRENIKAHDNNI